MRARQLLKHEPASLPLSPIRRPIVDAAIALPKRQRGQARRERFHQVWVFRDPADVFDRAVTGFALSGIGTGLQDQT